MNKKITNFALEEDNSTHQQFKDCYSEDFVTAASLMPDAHSGYVAPIGSVLVTKEKVVPSWVGYDIGCGMIACKFENNDSELLEKIKNKSEEIFNKVSQDIPMGKGKVNHVQNISKKTKDDFKELLNKFKEGEYKDHLFKYLRNKALSHLGTLGSGNHFIELGEHDNELWLVIHSGSRGIGHKVAQEYMKEAAHYQKGYEKTFPLDVNSQEGKEYLNILDFSMDFALLNRLEMAYKVKNALSEILEEDIDFQLWTNKHHNHAIYENGLYIHRKGATPAKKGERGVIPGNMKDGCYLVEGLGNKEFLESSSHGAGRKMSRKKARETIPLKDFQESMQEIKGNVSQDTIDEAPMAYKNISEVMEAQKESVKTLKHITPIINWKG